MQCKCLKIEFDLIIYDIKNKYLTRSQKILRCYEPGFAATYSTGFMKENPGKASLVPGAWHSFTEAGTGWRVNSGSM